MSDYNSNNVNMLDKIRALVLPLLDAECVEMIDLIYRREGNENILRFLVDKQGGITIDECAQLNKEIGNILDESDIMPGAYTLEVSSPGLNRLLKAKADFKRALGDMIWINIKEPINGKKGFEGEIINVSEIEVVIKTNKGMEVTIPLTNVIAAGRKIE